MWQHFYSTTDHDFEMVAIAVEHIDADAARPYVECAEADFPIVIDTEGVTTSIFGFKAVPNGILVDSDGIVRFVKAGGFSVEHQEDLATVKRWLQGESIEALVNAAPYELTQVESELVDARIRLGHLLNAMGRPDEAVREWRLGLRLDPENLVIRKQIWALQHPERFHPSIDWDWQREQLRREREAEVEEGVCDINGCRIP